MDNQVRLVAKLVASNLARRRRFVSIGDICQVVGDLEEYDQIVGEIQKLGFVVFRPYYDKGSYL